MSTTAQAVPTGTYTLDPVHSTFGFAVKHNGVSSFRGTFEQADAKLEDGVLVGTAQVDSVKTVIPDLKAHLLSADFFNAEQTPTISFTSTAIRAGDDGSVEVDGELTIRGISKPVTATGTFGAGTGISGKEVVGFDLEARVDRRQYGIEWQAPLPNGGEALGWDVTLEIHLELVEA
jgi:polyisoprenoid-binding protein YceI